ncbi:derepression protein [Klebsiella variicola]|uniref:Derepression protein n=1 Tax=Klebsiella variicola TaxID=244366 RepID=UPI001CDAFD82|nr:Derepression protein [Klebsiella variicola]
MHTENSIQRVSVRCDDTGTYREHLSIEAYHKLNRASAVTHFVGLDLKQRELSGLHQLSVPHILSYLHEDISYVLEELKAKGLCRDFVAPPSVSGGEQHV